MRFGKTLQAAIYPPWRDHYIDYSKLKRLLREGDDESDAERVDSPSGTTRSRNAPREEERGWTEHDESVFVEELINVQLEKVHNFQVEIGKKLKERMEACEARLEKIVQSQQAAEAEVKQDKGKEKDTGEGEGNTEQGQPKEPVERLSDEETKKILRETLKELDDITFHINQLQKFSRINFTGFLKAAKKHDRRSRATDGKGKQRDKDEGGARVRPLLQVRLSALDFNKEVYSPLLYRISAMYAFIRQQLEADKAEQQDQPQVPGESTRRYTSHKFWVHPDNYLEVKTHIVRRLPVLIYNPKHTKQIDVLKGDPTITSLYFDNDKFSLYTDKVEKKPGAASLRLRWYGQLASKPDISLERKTMVSASGDDPTAADTSAATESEDAIEERIAFKEKHVEAFIRGEYSMDKHVQKMRERQDKSDEDVEKYAATVKSLQEFIKENNLQPMLRAVYNRSAFQIPGDDSIRVSLDTNLAFIREDALDSERSCRDPDDWHRRDIDDAQMEYPFPAIRKGEIHRFPYALLEIKVRDGVPQRNVKWIYELMNSHLVQDAPRFSKFVHGVSTLFEDYVNSLPFWLGEMDKDIRKDPETAWQKEQELRARQAEDDMLVGSLKIGGSFAGRFAGGSIPRAGLWPTSLIGTPERALKLDYPGAGTTPPSNGRPVNVIEEDTGNEYENEDDENTGLLEGQNWDRFDNDNIAYSKSTLLGLFPGFSTSRYGRRHRKPISDEDFPLPPGVTKPEKLIMHSTPVNVEPKVWLANQRTFIKWEHVSILLATLSLGLYNAAGEHNTIARALGIAYTCIALFTGIWGYWVYIERCTLITERSGKDFDKKLGPVFVCVGLSVALILNFGFKYHSAMEKRGKHPGTSPSATATTAPAPMPTGSIVTTMVQAVTTAIAGDYSGGDL